MGVDSGYSLSRLSIVLIRGHRRRLIILILLLIWRLLLLVLLLLILLILRLLLELLRENWLLHSLLLLRERL